MIFTETKLKGAYVIELEPIGDKRGYFARTFCQREFESHGLQFAVAQSNTSYNIKLGTLRGMHYQVAPHEEAKLVRCTWGAIYDVIIDLRSESPTHKQWIGIKLTQMNNRMVYVPKRFAHGYLSLVDGTTVSYLVSESYHKESERTLKWDDPSIGIDWHKYITIDNCVISEKDKNANNI